MKFIKREMVEDEDFQHIKISGKTGYWSATEKCTTENATYYLYKNDNDICHIPFVIVEYVDEQPITTFDTNVDLLTFLESECII